MNPVGVVTPREAWKLLSKDPSAVLVDVRSRIEFDYVGHPPGAVHVPWKECPGWEVNPDFADQVRERLAALRPGQAPESLALLMLCRSGGRSLSAGQVLAERGFGRVMNVAEGFEGDLDADRHRGNLNGWRFHGLPWEQT